ncbi:MAG: aminotransferase class V-fold PLP-dependent enzyme [Clostridia bacterium]|nr:aminotransferase class V-fold PLP-dependent enzyme [Clostridia bacterium]
MIYLDNSATTRKKPQIVIDAVVKGLTILSANPGRSGHIASLKLALAIGEIREKIKDFIGAPQPENIIFTQNCTDSLNLAILGSARKGGHVITTAFEHNSTLRPLFELQKKGIIELTVVKPKNTFEITREDIEPYIKENTYLVTTIHVSNVDGAKSNINEIGKLCKDRGLLYLVDAAQSAGHECINMQKQNISLLALAGHKGLLGPQGIGVLAIGEDVRLNPIRYGGTGTESIRTYQPSEMPECFESGTIAGANILGLGAGVDFVIKNENNIKEKTEKLTVKLIQELKKIKGIKVYTDIRNLNGVVGFNIRNIDSTIVSEYLNEKYKICVRSGLHCAPLKHRHWNTIEQGIIRVSLSYFNTEEDINQLIYALKKFIEII